MTVPVNDCAAITGLWANPRIFPSPSLIFSFPPPPSSSFSSSYRSSPPLLTRPFFSFSSSSPCLFSGCHPDGALLLCAHGYPDAVSRGPDAPHAPAHDVSTDLRTSTGSIPVRTAMSRTCFLFVLRNVCCLFFFSRIELNVA